MIALPEMEQRSDEWFAARCGKATASVMSEILSKTRSGWGASRKNCEARLIAERMTGVPAASFTNAAMQWGIDHEDEGIDVYESCTGVETRLVGFVDHPTIKNSGASPDRLAGEKGLVEIKCPNTATHIETVLTEVIPKKYLDQMDFQMACTEREWCDFVSYDPRMPKGLQLWIKRIERDDDKIKELESHVSQFLEEVALKVQSLEDLKGEGK